MRRTISVLTIAASLMLTAIVSASAAEPGAWPWQPSANSPGRPAAEFRSLRRRMVEGASGAGLSIRAALVPRRIQA